MEIIQKLYMTVAYENIKITFGASQLVYICTILYCFV